MKHVNTTKLIKQKYFPIALKAFALLCAGITLGACAGAAPIITAIAKTFGANLLSTAILNYSPKYGKDLEDLLYVMAGTKKSNNQQEYSEQVADNQFQENQEYQEYQPNEVQSSFVDTDLATNESQQYESSIQEAEYDPGTADQQWQDAEIAMGVDVLVQRAGDASESTPVPIWDGETLYSNPADPNLGDKIKVSFNANCDCYIYVVAIDSTGYVVQIFPDPQAGLTNPVRRDRDYLVPEGSEWYGLDEYTGTEEIYFIASKNRRLDLERIIKKLSEQERNIGEDYLAVQVAAVIPKTRGLVKISSSKTSFVQSTSGQSYAFSPTLFISNAKNADLAITRWFYHQ